MTSDDRRQLRVDFEDRPRVLPPGGGNFGPFPPDRCDSDEFCSRTLIEVLDPCDSPLDFQGNGIVRQPDPYEYVGNLEFTLREPTYEPSERQCNDVTYECKAMSDTPSGGSGCNMCQIGQLRGRDFSFQTFDNQRCPPGVYTIDFELCLGDKCDIVEVDVEILGPCSDTQLTLLPSPFPSYT